MDLPYLEPVSGFWSHVNRIAYGIARRKFRLSHPDAEDIAQEMAIRVVQRRRTREVNASWIRTGATFLCIDFLRTVQAEDSLLARYATEHARGPIQFLPPQLAAGWDIAMILEELPLGCQLLLRKYFWEGMTWKEIDEAICGRRTSQYQTRKCIEMIQVKLARLLN